MEYISPAEMLRFFNDICNYSGEPHAAAASWQCTYVFIIVLWLDTAWC